MLLLAKTMALPLSTEQNKQAVAIEFAKSFAPPQVTPQSTQFTSTQLGGSGGFGGGGGGGYQAPQSTQVTSTQLGGTPQVVAPAPQSTLSQLLGGQSTAQQQAAYQAQQSLLGTTGVSAAALGSREAIPASLGYPMSLNPSAMSVAPQSKTTNWLDRIIGFGENAYQQGTQFVNRVYEASPFNFDRYIQYQRVQGFDENGNPVYVTAPEPSSVALGTFASTIPTALSSIPKSIPVRINVEAPQNVAFLGTRRTLGFQGETPRINTQLVYQTEKGQFGKFASTSYGVDDSLVSIGAGKNIVGGKNNFVGFAVGQSKETPVIIGRDVSAYPVTSIYREFPGAKGLSYGRVLNKEGATTFLSGGVEAQSKGVNALIGKVYTKGGEGTYAGLLRTGTSDFAKIDDSLIGRSTQQAISQARASLPLTKQSSKIIQSTEIRPIASLITTSEVKPTPSVKTQSKLSQSLVSDQSLAAVTTQASKGASIEKTISVSPSLLGTSSVQRQPQSNLSQQGSKEIQRADTSLISIQTQSEIQRQPQQSIQREIQREQTTQSQVQPQILQEKQRLRSNISDLVPPSALVNKRRNKLRKSQFLAITKRRKKEIILGVRSTPQEAEKLAADVSLRTLARSVIVRESTTGQRVPLQSISGFRPSKRNPNQLVQINPLSARSEQIEIKAAKRNAPRKFKKVKLRKARL